MILSEIKSKKQTVTEIESQVFDKEYDVAVCGLGTAGSLAALFSAENGLSVLGIERYTCVGGIHSAGGIMEHYFENPGGRYEAVDKEVKEFSKHTAIETESRKIITEEKIIKSGAEILYESSICGVYLENKTVVGLKVISDGKILNIKTKVVMDCTADAYIAHIAGCETEYGRKTDNQAQPYTSVSLMYDGKNYSITNFDFGRVDPTDDKEFSEAVIFARALEKRVERYGGRQFIAHMPLIGLREGRRIIAEETVTINALFENRETETPMFLSYADMDKHGLDTAFDGEELSDWAIGSNLGAYNATVAVPYKAILPKNYDGILVPCRALGVSREISCCVRMIPDMKKLAEAASEWASLAIKQNKKLREVAYASLREKLTESGCLDANRKRVYRVDGKNNWNGKPLETRDVEFLTKPRQLKKVLKTDKPGEAIWSAKLIGEKAIPTLRRLLKSRNKNLRKHSAFALAILGNDEGNKILRETVEERDGFMLKDCRKKNNFRGVVAIYWLGRLGDEKSVDILSEIISNENEVKHPTYKLTDPTTFYLTDFRGIYFQFVSHSVMALIRIGDKHTYLRTKITKLFEDVFSNDDYYNRITKRAPMSSEGNMTLTIKKHAFMAIDKWKSDVKKAKTV